MQNKFLEKLKYFFWIPSSVLGLVLTCEIETLLLGDMRDAQGTVPSNIAVGTLIIYTLPIWAISAAILTTLSIFIFQRKLSIKSKLLLIISNLFINLVTYIALLLIAFFLFMLQRQ